MNAVASVAATLGIVSDHIIRIWELRYPNREPLIQDANPFPPTAPTNISAVN